MAEKRKIAVCVTSIHQKTVHRMMSELGSEAAKRGYEVHFFALFSDLYYQTESDLAQRQIFELIPYDDLCALILFTETIHDPALLNQLAGQARKRDYQLPLLTTAIYDPHLSSITLLDTLDQLQQNRQDISKSVRIPCKNAYTESCGCIEHDILRAENRLMKTYNQLVRERQYSHATHDLVNAINAEGTVSVLAEKLSEYLWGPEITEYNLYLDAPFVVGGKWEEMEIGSRQFVLYRSKQEKQEKMLSPYQEGSEAEVRLYGLSHQILTIPLNVEGNIYGLFSMSYEGNRINHECLYELVMTLNDGLHSIHSRADLLRVSRQLNEVSEQTIQSLAEIVEAKSEFTGLHVKRVSEYTRILAEAMGYSPAKVNIIRIASMMHDIGKINIPSEILEKPGKLTEEEFEIIKGHVKDGKRMLQNASGEIMETACRIAYEHHEKWNGTGYLGMAGEEIALESRIVALADVFDALVSRRPYKTPFTAERAYEIITQDSGTHFDPQVVEAFRGHFGRFLQVLSNYQDEEAVG